MNQSDSEDPCESVIHSVIQLIRAHHWMLDFLFPSAQDLSQLSHAIVHPFVLFAEATLRVLPTAPGSGAGEEPEQTVFAPLFVIDHFMAGFIIYNRLNSDKSFERGPPRYLSKAIRDSRTASYVTVCEHPLGLTEMRVMQRLSPACRSQTIAIFETERFKKLLDTSNASSSASSSVSYALNPNAALRNALLSTFYSFEMRKCPSCQADTFLSCSCPTGSLSRPAISILDSAIEIEVGHLMDGSYEGELSHRIYQHGKFLRAYETQAVVTSRLFRNRAATQQLTSWAMTDVTSKMHVNIVKLCMSTANLEERHTKKDEMEPHALLEELRQKYLLDRMKDFAESYRIVEMVHTAENSPRKLPSALEEHERIMDTKPFWSGKPLSKDEVRKIRNRVSAHKSNERKRRYVNELKSNLKNMEEKEKCLRSKLEMLQSENRDMKRQVMEKWGHGLEADS